MKHQWLTESDRSDLLVVFGGWALGAAPFAGMKATGSVLLVDDYTTLTDPLPDLARFDHVDLLAFSFGVPSAAHWMDETGFRPDRTVAVSGTLHPADLRYGIAPDTIRATADNLSEANFAKFCRRSGLKSSVPELNVEAAKVELHAILQRGSARDPGFDRIWIPDRDRVIPTSAQEAAWASHAEAVRRIPGPHVPFQPRQDWAGWLA